jgi:hypothetical protein
LHLYAHCLRGKPGGVALLAINADQIAPQSVSIPKGAERYTLTAKQLQESHVDLNGIELSLGPDDALPPMRGVSAPEGPIMLAPASITFLAFPKAHNASCQ